MERKDGRKPFPFIVGIGGEDNSKLSQKVIPDPNIAVFTAYVPQTFQGQ